MANYFYALLNFFCSFGLMLRNYNCLTIGKVSSPNSALELNLGHRISLLTQNSPTGINQTLLRVPHKLMRMKRAEVPQIILVPADSPSPNQYTNSSLLIEKIRTHSNGGNPSSRHLGLESPRFPLRPGQSRPLRRYAASNMNYVKADNLQHQVCPANKETRSPGPEKSLSRSPFMTTYSKLGQTKSLRPKSENKDSNTQVNVLKNKFISEKQTTRTPGTYRISTLITSHKPLPGHNKLTQMGENPYHSVQNNVNQNTRLCKGATHVQKTPYQGHPALHQYNPQ